MLRSAWENPARVERSVRVPEGLQPSRLSGSEGGGFPGGAGQELLCDLLLSSSARFRTLGEKLPVPLELRTEIALA